MKPRFSPAQGVKLSALGLLRRQIELLEVTLEPARAWMLAEQPPMQDVLDLLTKSRDAVESATEFAESILNPLTPAWREARNRALLADDCRNPEQAEAAENAYIALLDFKLVLDQAADALPRSQRRKKTDLQLFARIDRALDDGFLEETGFGIPGLPLKLYKRMTPSNGGRYRAMIRIYYDALELPAGDRNPDQAIRNYVAWLKKRTGHVSSRQRH